MLYEIWWEAMQWSWRRAGGNVISRLQTFGKPCGTVEDGGTCLGEKEEEEDKNISAKN